jgi:hypothetical protein
MLRATPKSLNVLSYEAVIEMLEAIRDISPNPPSVQHVSQSSSGAAVKSILPTSCMNGMTASSHVPNQSPVCRTYETRRYNLLACACMYVCMYVYVHADLRGHSRGSGLLPQQAPGGVDRDGASQLLLSCTVIWTKMCSVFMLDCYVV